jgi:hypothetical protein
MWVQKALQSCWSSNPLHCTIKHSLLLIAIWKEEWYGDAMIVDEEIIAQLSAKLVKSGLYTSKKGAVQDVAKKLGVKTGKIADEDMKEVRRILSRGDPLSKIAMSSRGS